MRGIIVEQKDIMNLEGCSKATACRRMATLRDAMGVKKVTVYQFCKYFGYTIEEFLQHCKPSANIAETVAKFAQGTINSSL